MQEKVEIITNNFEHFWNYWTKILKNGYCVCQEKVSNLAYPLTWAFLLLSFRLALDPKQRRGRCAPNLPTAAVTTLRHSLTHSLSQLYLPPTLRTVAVVVSFS